MKNRSLGEDYLLRAKLRCGAVDYLFKNKAYADTVRESQEIVELALKGLLRLSHIEVPRIHDVGEILLTQITALPEEVRPHVEHFADVSRRLRRDRELAFYGAEDLTPSEFYKRADAETARDAAVGIVDTLFKALKLSSR